MKNLVDWLTLCTYWVYLSVREIKKDHLGSSERLRQVVMGSSVSQDSNNEKLDFFLK